MKITDAVYGSFEITEPVLLELINSKPLQRLKGISQYGLPYKYYPLKGFTRYDHSIGAMLLLRKLGASLTEQIAGLIHDVSHTAFSHLADLVLGDPSKENFQDEHHEVFIKGSEIPKILARFDLDTDEIIDEHNFGLLERPAPDLCADRLDYTLRELEIRKICAVKPLVESLIVHNNKIMFDSKKCAEVFSKNYVNLQSEHWGGTEYKIRWNLFADALKTALKEKVISEGDFYETDDYVIGKLKASNNLKIKELLEKLSGEIRFKFVDKNPQFVLNKKFRWVDPEIFENGIVKRLSEVDPGYKKLLEEKREINKKGEMIVLLN
jgi:hypothetical protein